MRIVLDPEELNRFAAFVAEAADDHGERATRLRALESPSMPDEVASIVTHALSRVASDLEALSAGLYAEALGLRVRAAALDPVLRTYLMRGLTPPA